VRVERGWSLQEEELNEKTQRLAAEEARVKVARLETALDATSSQVASTTRAISKLQKQILELQEALKGQKETQQARGPAVVFRFMALSHEGRVCRSKRS
jgi:hypothetical protein